MVLGITIVRSGESNEKCYWGRLDKMQRHLKGKVC
jgi:hypothetical protein